MKKVSIVFVLMIALVLMLAVCGGNDAPADDVQVQAPDSGSQIATATPEPIVLPEPTNEPVQSETDAGAILPSEYYTFGDSLYLSYDWAHGLTRVDFGTEAVMFNRADGGYRIGIPLTLEHVGTGAPNSNLGDLFSLFNSDGEEVPLVRGQVGSNWPLINTVTNFARDSTRRGYLVFDYTEDGVYYLRANTSTRDSNWAAFEIVSDGLGRRYHE